MSIDRKCPYIFLSSHCLRDISSDSDIIPNTHLSETAVSTCEYKTRSLDPYVTLRTCILPSSISFTTSHRYLSILFQPDIISRQLNRRWKEIISISWYIEIFRAAILRRLFIMRFNFIRLTYEISSKIRIFNRNDIIHQILFFSYG